MGTGRTLLMIALMMSLLSHCMVHSQPPPVMDFASFCNEVATTGNSPNAFVELLCRQLAETFTIEVPTSSDPPNVSNVFNTTTEDRTDNGTLATTKQPLSPRLSNDSYVNMEQPNNIAKNISNENSDVKQNTTRMFTLLIPGAVEKQNTVLNDTVLSVPAEPLIPVNNNTSAAPENVGFLSNFENQFLHFPPQNISCYVGEPVGQQRGIGEIDEILPSTATDSINETAKTNETNVESAQTSNATAFHSGGTNITNLKRGDIMPVILNGKVIPNQDPRIPLNATLNSERVTNHSLGAPLSSNVKESNIQTVSNVTNTNTLTAGEEPNEHLTISTLNASMSQGKLHTESEQQSSNLPLKNETSRLQAVVTAATNYSSTALISTNTYGKESNVSDESENRTSNGSVPSALVVTPNIAVSIAANKSRETRLTLPISQSGGEQKYSDMEQTTVIPNKEAEAESSLPSEQVTGGNLKNNQSSGSDSSRNPGLSNGGKVGEKAERGIPSQQQVKVREENGSEVLLNKQNNGSFIVERSSVRSNISTENKKVFANAVPSPNAVLVENNVTGDKVVNTLKNHLNDSSSAIWTNSSTIPVYEENQRSREYIDPAGAEEIVVNEQSKGISNENGDQSLIVGQEIETSTNFTQVLQNELENQSNSLDLNISDSSSSKIPDDKKNVRPAEIESDGNLTAVSSSKSPGSELIPNIQASTPVSKFTVSETSEIQKVQTPLESANQKKSESAFEVKSPESKLTVNQQEDVSKPPHQVTKEINISYTEKKDASSASEVTASLPGLADDGIQQGKTVQSTKGILTTEKSSSEVRPEVAPSNLTSKVPTSTSRSADSGIQHGQSVQSTKQRPARVKPSSEMPPELVSSILKSSQGTQKTILIELSTVFLGSLADVHCEQSQQQFWRNVSAILQRVGSSNGLSLEDVTRSVTEVIESYRRDSPYWSPVATRLEESTSDGEWQQLLRHLVLRHAGEPAAQIRLLTAATTLRAAVRAAVSSPECRASGLHPVSGSCDVYLLCYRAGWLWRSLQLPCPRGSAFSVSQHRCVWRPLADCHPHDEEDDSDSSDSSDSDSRESDSSESEEKPKPWPLRFGLSLLRFLGLRRS